MNKFHGSVAVITGAGSGIGRALSYQLAGAGARLAISDINPDNLEQTRAHIAETGVEVVATPLDVANQTAVFNYAEVCRQQFGTVNLVINNAGVALSSGPVWSNSMDDFKWLMDINFYGVLSGTKAFLPILREADWGHIVNISSVFGLIGVPNQAAYNSSKFAVRGLTEAMRQELKIDGSKVSCTSVHPGGIKTNIARSARFVEESSGLSGQQREKVLADFDRLAMTTPEKAADKILKGVLKDKPRVLIGSDAWVIDRIQRWFPTLYPKFFSGFFQKTLTADADKA